MPYFYQIFVETKIRKVGGLEIDMIGYKSEHCMFSRKGIGQYPSHNRFRDNWNICRIG